MYFKLTKQIRIGQVSIVILNSMKSTTYFWIVPYRPAEYRMSLLAPPSALCPGPLPDYCPIKSTVQNIRNAFAPIKIRISKI